MYAISPSCNAFFLSDVQVRRNLGMQLPSIANVLAIDPFTMAYGSAPSSLVSNSTTIRWMVQDTLQSSRLELNNMEDVRGHLHGICKLRLSNGSRLVLKLSPSPSTVLLRHERYFLESEATILSFLKKSSLPIPRILRYDPSSIHLGSPFLLSTHVPGISYADALPHLTKSECRNIELQLRSLNSNISQYISPTFGPAALVASNKGFSTWRESFKSMLESMMMDAEDTTINLPYHAIREAASSVAKELHDVKEARLLVLGLGRPQNVILDRRTNDVIGLLDFGQAIWGDPAFSAPEICCGRKGLLYVCYHALVTIVTNHYRPQRDAKELTARKTLTTTLAQLALREEGA